MENKTVKIPRYQCANCGFIFDKDNLSYPTLCPKCGSNACDKQNN